ncbi:hypothetical protein AJ80_08770 [Polytolypa hystricis UAMH7299]|uniref:Vacuolar sorting protein Vps3844 C-terminal domain-containing protein n=1 Tax=Polytolypa hystricis (strain UAMH7299) TaxID=1447883 RepID=A0A2B7X263_POLH7|nr:hypothetical protein AJ80_08770 [Polytolypa hystricis UAMH7299]
MKNLLPLLTVPLSVLAASPSHEANIFTFDPEQSRLSLLNTEAKRDGARLLLAQRLGVSEGLELGKLDENDIAVLRDFGGGQSHLLGSHPSGDDVSRLLLVWESSDIKATPLAELSTNNIAVPDVPTDFFGDAFYDELMPVSNGGSKPRPCSYSLAVDSTPWADLVISVPNAVQCPSNEDIFPWTADTLPEKDVLVDFISRGVTSWLGRRVRAILRFKPEPKSNPAIDHAIISVIFEKLQALADDSTQQTTALILPRGMSNGSGNKFKSHQQEKRNKREERILSQAPPKKPETAPNSPVSRLVDTPSTLMPVCHASNSSCTEATNNCSGHGSCYRKYGSKEGGAGECYACKCSRTVVRTNDDGTVKTVQWGGPACQKADISTPFFMIASFTILLVMAVTWGISLLFSIGQEDLPSVLGAGVASTRAQK